MRATACPPGSAGGGWVTVPVRAGEGTTGMSATDAAGRRPSPSARHGRTLVWRGRGLATAADTDAARRRARGRAAETTISGVGFAGTVDAARSHGASVRGVARRRAAPPSSCASCLRSGYLGANRSAATHLGRRASAGAGRRGTGALRALAEPPRRAQHAAPTLPPGTAGPRRIAATSVARGETTSPDRAPPAQTLSLRSMFIDAVEGRREAMLPSPDEGVLLPRAHG